MNSNQSEPDRLAAELQAVNRQLAEAEVANRRLRTQLRTAQGNEDRLQAQLRALRRSFSWRVTYPIRVLGRRLKKKAL